MPTAPRTEPASARLRETLPWLPLLVAAAAAAYLIVPHLPRVGAGGTLSRVAAYLALGAFALLLESVLGGAAPLTRISRRALGVGAVTSLVATVTSTLAEVPVATDLAKLAFAACTGTLLALAIERLTWVPLLAVVISVADLWSVLSRHGVTNNAIAEHAETIPWGTIVLPIPGVAYGEGAALGVVDLLFSALFIAVAYLWGLGVWRTVLALAIGVAVTFAVAVELAGSRPLPALPFLSAAFLVVHARPLVRAARTN